MTVARSMQILFEFPPFLGSPSKQAWKVESSREIKLLTQFCFNVKRDNTLFLGHYTQLMLSLPLPLSHPHSHSPSFANISRQHCFVASLHLYSCLWGQIHAAWIVKHSEWKWICNKKLTCLHLICPLIEVNFGAPWKWDWNFHFSLERFFGCSPPVSGRDYSRRSNRKSISRLSSLKVGILIIIRCSPCLSYAISTTKLATAEQQRQLSHYLARSGSTACILMQFQQHYFSER